MGFRRKIKRVVDGDTVELHTNLNGSRFIRLANVNAPEKNQFGGSKATNTLRGMVGGRVVTINPVARDRFGRTVANVSCDHQSVNSRMKRKLNRW